MSKNMCRMTGIIAMIISVFLILGGMYLPNAGISGTITTISLIVGLILLILGVIFYKILKTDEK